jgi:hypothetical protein
MEEKQIPDYFEHTPYYLRVLLIIFTLQLICSLHYLLNSLAKGIQIFVTRQIQFPSKYLCHCVKIALGTLKQSSSQDFILF